MQCSAQVFKRAGCHLKKGTLAQRTDRQKGTLARWTDRQKGTLARWTEEKGHNQRGKRMKKGTTN